AAGQDGGMSVGRILVMGGCRYRFRRSSRTLDRPCRPVWILRSSASRGGRGYGCRAFGGRYRCNGQIGHAGVARADGATDERSMQGGCPDRNAKAADVDLSLLDLL